MLAESQIAYLKDEIKFSVKISDLSVKLFISQCTYFATLNIFQRLFDVPARCADGHRTKLRDGFVVVQVVAHTSCARFGVGDAVLQSNAPAPQPRIAKVVYGRDGERRGETGRDGERRGETGRDGR